MYTHKFTQILVQESGCDLCVGMNGIFCYTHFDYNHTFRMRGVFEWTVPLWWSGGHCLVIGFVDRVLNPPLFYPPPTYTQPPFPPLLLLFYSQSPFKYLTLHQPLCVSALQRLTQRYPIDTRVKPSVHWMCQNWLGFQSGCTCKCKRYLFSPITPANSYTHWGLVVGNLIPIEE